MISVKDAVKAATAFFSELFPNAKELRLEEVDMSEGGPWWEVTVSFEVPGNNPMQSILASSHREYKIVRVDRDTGEPRSILIRKP
jgi:hypothetical protein